MFTDLCPKETCRCATYDLDILLLKDYNDLCHLYHGCFFAQGFIIAVKSFI